MLGCLASIGIGVFGRDGASKNVGHVYSVGIHLLDFMHSTDI
jgi:hypothetical protein